MSRSKKKSKSNRIEKLTSLYGDMVDKALEDSLKLKSDAQSVIIASSSEAEINKDEIEEAYKSLVMSYYIGFQTKTKFMYSFSFETYWGMLINSCPEIFGNRLAYYESIYGSIPGLKYGHTDVFDRIDDTREMRLFENSLIFARTEKDGWVLVHKQSKKSMGINYKVLSYTSSKDYVMGFAKCLFINEGFINVSEL